MKGDSQTVGPQATHLKKLLRRGPGDSRALNEGRKGSEVVQARQGSLLKSARRRRLQGAVLADSVMPQGLSLVRLNPHSAMRIPQLAGTIAMGCGKAGSMAESSFGSNVVLVSYQSGSAQKGEDFRIMRPSAD